MTRSARALIESIEGEFRRYQALAEGAIDQVADADLTRAGSPDDNAIATICWHIAGNLRSRFTEFLTADGEKPWRRREEEFDGRPVTRAELLAHWQAGWNALHTALDGLMDEDLDRTVTIRQQPLAVRDALHRSLAHTAYHVGQIVYVAKSLRGSAWKSLSIPRGQSAAYNSNPTGERPPGRS